MTSRERVLAALNHEQPDRTPRDFWAEPPTWNRLLAYCGTDDREAVLERLGIDVRHVDAVAPAEREVRPGVFRNMWGEQYVYQETGWGPMREDVKGALAEAESLEELEGFEWPSPEDMDTSELAAECERHEAYALLYGSADIWQRPALVRGWEEMFLDMVERPDWVHALCRRFCDFYLEDYSRAQALAKGRIDLFLLISDLGSQTAPLISPAMFREFVAPYIAEMTERIHELGARVLFHSCGAMHAFIPDLIELGVDALDPIQPVAAELEPEALKRDFGGAICFHGGIDMQTLLPKGTPEEVRDTARRYCEVLGEGGGYILGPAHLFQPDVPPENIVALYDEAP